VYWPLVCGVWLHRSTLCFEFVGLVVALVDLCVVYVLFHVALLPRYCYLLVADNFLELLRPKLGSVIKNSNSLQIYDIRVSIGNSLADLQWPLQVFGVIAVRDSIDSMRNILFNRDRDDCQTLTKEVLPPCWY
jgi:hypothetical protein